VLVGVVALVVYRLTSRGSTPYDQYVRETDALLHGRLYILNPPSWLELIRIGNHGYVLEPPGPCLLLLPFVIWSGLSVNAVTVSILVGSAAIGFLWVAMARLGWSLPFRVGVTILVALGTDLWWIITSGGVWMFAQTSAVFFTMWAFSEGVGRNRPWAVGLLAGLAGTCRIPTFLMFPFWAYLVARGCPRREGIQRVLTMGAVMAVFGLALIFFLHLEFGGWGHTGYSSQQGNQPWFNNGFWNVAYIPHQVKALLLTKPIFGGGFPWVRPSAFGLGLFFCTPALLYMFRTRLGAMERAAVAGLALTAIPILTYGGVGFQFGFRYTVDFLLAMVMLTASGMRYRLTRLIVAVIALSVLINLWGVLSFNIFNWEVI
jgi:hypothetical protein